MSKPRVPEKVVQQQIVRALTAVGGRVYVLGTRRPTGDYQGTRQTPGLPDVLAFLPPQAGRPLITQTMLLMVEVKDAGGRLRPEQAIFRDLCRQADVAHVTGGLDDVLAWLMDRGYLKREGVPWYRQEGR